MHKTKYLMHRAAVVDHITPKTGQGQSLIFSMPEISLSIIRE